jgi:nicotinate-nucleotide adenylyltransferase
MKVGIFSGTFDPVHTGHLAFAKEAVAAGQLGKVVIVAEKEPYRKKPHTSWDHRQAMIERATENIDRVDHDYQFAAELAKQHTVADMLVVASRHYKDSEIWFLVGSDVLEHMHIWEDIAHHKSYGGFITALRRDHSKEWALSQLEVMKRRGYEPKTIIIDSPMQSLGSTSIRQQLAEGKEPEDLREQVLEYINRHQLYAAEETGSSSE